MSCWMLKVGSEVQVTRPVEVGSRRLQPGTVGTIREIDRKNPTHHILHLFVSEFNDVIPGVPADAVTALVLDTR